MKFTILLSAALIGLADACRGHRLATNNDVTAGLPPGLDPTKVLARKQALIKAGTDPLLAAHLAVECEQNQAHRDRLNAENDRKEKAAAQKPPAAAPAAPAAHTAESLGAMTVSALTELAQTNGYDLGASTKKTDIVAAILAAAKTGGAAMLAIFAALFLCLGQTQAQAAPEAAFNHPAFAAAPAIVELRAAPALPAATHAFAQAPVADVWRNPISIALAALGSLLALGARISRRALRSLGFLASLWLRRLVDSLRGQRLAFNAVMTPPEVKDGVASLHGTAAIATKNYVVVRGADDQHFKIGTSVNDVPLGILINDEIALDEVDVVKKGIALFGVHKGTLPAVAEAAIAVDAELTPGVGTFGRVKTLPVVAGSYMVIGRSRTTVAAAGDPVSIVHCVPYIRVVA